MLVFLPLNPMLITIGKDFGVNFNSRQSIAKQVSINPIDTQVIRTKFTREPLQQFLTKYDDTVLPVDTVAISSPFGPRLRASRKYSYEFHLGIDFAGKQSDPVRAIADGKVYRVYLESDPSSPYPNGGNVIILKHTMDKPINFHGQSFNTYYSLYMHLDRRFVSNAKINNRYPTVFKGQQIGTMGNSGTTDFYHLHFETRIGSLCSYSYQLRNPNLICSNVFKQPQDPHVNPFIFLDYSNENSLDYYMDHDSITITTARAELDFNYLYISINNRVTEIDLNARNGINKNDINQNRYSGYQLLPAKFNKDTEKYELKFYVPNIDQANQIIIKDIWGNGYLLSR